MKEKKRRTLSKVAAIICIASVSTILLTSCEADGAFVDNYTTRQVTREMQSKQSTPDDITYSLQRYNLIRRAYWTNGMREKAMGLECDVVKPKGYIYMFLDGVGCIGSYTVDGQITSLNSYLTPDSEFYSSSSTINWLPDVDGTYGENQEGIFFFTEDGNYVEWNGKYLYSDIYYPDLITVNGFTSATKVDMSK